MRTLSESLSYLFIILSFLHFFLHFTFLFRDVVDNKPAHFR